VTNHPHHSEAYCPHCDRSFDSTTRVCPDDGTRLVDLSARVDVMVGRTIDGRFTVRERLGSGGMGVVYQAWQASVGREVAIKVILPRPGDDRATAKRFLREAKLASHLQQPNIVGVIDFGATEDGTLYLAMELLRGRTLSQVTRGEGPFAPKRVLRIASQLCDALESAHRAGIVHRDLKPANVMILDEPAGRDFVKVLDFGLAKALDAAPDTSLTQSDRIVGTPSYMSPEVITGGRVDTRADLYSVGVMLFEMLTGRLPYDAPNANAMLARHAYAPVPDLDGGVPEQVAYVVKKLLAKRPEQRIASASKLREALEAAVAGELVMEAPSEQALVTTLEQLEGSTISGLRKRGMLGEASTVESPLPRRPEPPTASIARPAPRSRARIASIAAGVALSFAIGAAIAVLTTRDRGASAPPSSSTPARQMTPPDAAPPAPGLLVTPDAAPAATAPTPPTPTTTRTPPTSPLPAPPRPARRGKPRAAPAPHDAPPAATHPASTAPPPTDPGPTWVDPE